SSMCCSTRCISLLPFFFYCSLAHRARHSFPTRRSSDLHQRGQHDHRLAAVLAQDARGDRLLALRLDRHFAVRAVLRAELDEQQPDRKSTRLNSSHVEISYAVFCLKKKKKKPNKTHQNRK